MRFYWLAPTTGRITLQLSMLLMQLIVWLLVPDLMYFSLIGCAFVVGFPLLLGDLPYLRWKISYARDQGREITIEGYRVRYTITYPRSKRGGEPSEYDECMEEKHLSYLLIDRFRNKFTDMVVKSCNRCVFIIKNKIRYRREWDTKDVLRMEVFDADGVPAPIRKFNLWRFRRGIARLIRFLDHINQILSANGAPEAMKAIAC